MRNRIQSHFLLKRLTALLLACMLFLSVNAFAAPNTMFATSGGGNSVDVYVRIFVPSEYSPATSIGHYDFMVKGMLRLKGKTFVNPVFSYRTDGTLDIFSQADTAKVYAHKSKSDYLHGCHMYTYHRRVSDTRDVTDFLDEVGSHVKSVRSHPRTSKALKCTLKKDSGFARYDVFHVNCYSAVAVWMKCFGDSSLLNFYRSVHSGKASSYLPSAFIKKFSVSKVF